MNKLFKRYRGNIKSISKFCLGEGKFLTKLGGSDRAGVKQ
jgi:hypothetical protein